MTPLMRHFRPQITETPLFTRFALWAAPPTAVRPFSGETQDLTTPCRGQPRPQFIASIHLDTAIFVVGRPDAHTTGGRPDAVGPRGRAGRAAALPLALTAAVYPCPL